MVGVGHISRKVTAVPVSWYPVPGESELPKGLQGLFRKARERVRFVPNVLRAYSLRPSASPFGSPTTGSCTNRRRTWTPSREMIAVAVSMANGCLYCLAAHGAALREALGDLILADCITLGYRGRELGERSAAILDFAVKITDHPLECELEDLERLKGFGLSEEEVWNVVETSCF